MNKSTTVDSHNIETFYTKNYQEKDIKELCEVTASTIMQLYFAKTIVSNDIYEKDIFKLIKKLIIKKISSNEKETEFNLLLCVHIFKTHFRLIFEFLSELIMKEVAYSNDGVIGFLKYYSIDTIVVNRVKYKVPQIKEEDGPRWNVTSMLGVLKTYVKTQDQVGILNNNIQKLEVKIQGSYVNGIDPIEHNLNLSKDYQKLELKIKNNASQITIIHDSLSILTKELDIIKANQELQDAQEQRMLLRDEKSRMTKSKVKQLKMLEYQELLKQVDSLQRDLSPKMKIIKQGKDSYLSIQKSLIKALISKKQVL